ncbi:site-specific integrase [Castellaniella sp. MT123]|uniref:site-specific integrase n=1 Tax=Castellaniella sp. MT123 TaxID=3140381 RepID=UPI0031F3C9BC
MASITKRGSYQYQATIRRSGYPTQTKTFETKREAEAWSATVESKMARKVFVDLSEAERTTFGEVLKRYEREVTPTHKGAPAERARLQQLQKHPLALRSLASLRSVDFSTYRDERLGEVAPKTVHLELSLMSSVLVTANKDWSIPISNPIANIRKPKLPPGRERRLEDDEEARLFAATSDARASTLSTCVILAIETGMRRGEIALLTWNQVDFKNKVIRLDAADTKNGERRIVPLSETAEEALLSLPRPLHGGRLMSFHDSNGLGAAFARACERAGIEGLRFHDLRHEAASRLSKKMPPTTLAKIMGWKTLQMAMRYYNPTANELVDAIRKVA